MFLTDISLKRPVFATVTVLALVVMGIMSYFGLGLNDYPDVEFPYVAVTIIEPGASPEQVEKNVSQKVEEALSQVAGVKHITTRAREGVSLVFAEFTLETSPSVATQNVRDKIGLIRGQLPADCREPIIANFDPASQPIISLSLSGDVTKRDLTFAVRDIVKKRLETINGVGSVDISGEEEREIKIYLDKDKLSAYNLSTQEVLNALRNENMDVPAGKVSTNDREVTLRTVGGIKQLPEFSNLAIAQRSGTTIYLKDIASIQDGTKELDSTAFYQGKPAIGIDIVKQSGSNTVQVADQVMKAVNQIKSELPAGMMLDVVKDNSVGIRESVRDVVITILQGGLLATITVLLFLGNWRTTLISAIAIPTSIITTFFAMKSLHFTLNNMSLMGLSLSVGLLIDDAIVVIENIERHMKQGKSALQAVKDATKEISLAVLATTFTLVAVFLPVGMMNGIVGQFFKEFGITVVSAVLVSLFISFTLVPLLSSRYLKNDESNQSRVTKFLKGFNGWFEVVAKGYAKVLQVVLRHRLKSLALAIILFVASLGLIPLMGSDFVPKVDMGELSVVLEMDSGLSLATEGQITQKIESLIRKTPEVVSTYSTVKGESAYIYVKVVDKTKRKKSLEELARQFRVDLNQVAGVKASVNISTVGPGGGGKSVEYSLLGPDQDELQKYSEEALKIMEGIPGAVDVGSSYKPGKPEVQIRINRDKANDLGISTAAVADTLRTLFSGVVVNQFGNGENRYDIRVQLTKNQRGNLDNLQNIYLFSSHQGSNGPVMVPLSQVTEKVFASSSSEIARYDRSPEIQLTANLDGLSLGEFDKQFQTLLKEKVKLPEGYRFQAGRSSEMMGDTFTTMGIALFTGVLFIFFILAAQYESYIDPFSIMLSLPMAIIGAILGLMIAGSSLSLMSMIGIIMLMGLVTKNGILLIDFAKQQRANGMRIDDALVKAGELRLRPITMTSIAMILGMLPLALGLGTGAEARAPMAHAIIGGLITSTILTLFIVPVIYSLLDQVKSKVNVHNPFMKYDKAKHTG